MSGSIFTDASSTVNSVTDARKCLVLSCRKKHAYARVDGRKVYSRYCPRHTCDMTVSPEDGYHCPTAREDGQKYCPAHMTCAAERCGEKGTYPDASLPWYCQSHRCTKDDCQAGSTNLLKRRCSKHEECEAPQCFESPDRGSNSSFCKAHTCQQVDCPNQAHPKTGRCSEHASCSTHTCDRPRFLHPGGRVDSRCEAHKKSKCEIADCNARRLHTTKPYCLDHGCRIPRCAEERHLGGGTLCDVHKCTFDTCFDAIANPDSDRSLFCVAHACRAPGCLYSRQHPSFYCASHKCQLRSCQKAACDGPGSLCATHDPRREPSARTTTASDVRCVEAGCDRPRLSARLGEGETDGEEDLVRCLRHDREYMRNAIRERDGWKDKYERLLRETGAKDKSTRDASKEARDRKRRHATVEDSEDSGLY